MRQQLKLVSKQVFSETRCVRLACKKYYSNSGQIKPYGHLKEKNTGDGALLDTLRMERDAVTMII